MPTNKGLLVRDPLVLHSIRILFGLKRSQDHTSLFHLEERKLYINIGRPCMSTCRKTDKLKQITYTVSNADIKLPNIHYFRISFILTHECLIQFKICCARNHHHSFHQRGFLSNEQIAFLNNFFGTFDVYIYIYRKKSF